MKKIFRKSLIIGTIILFIGASVIPSISANIEKDDILLKIEQNQTRGVIWEDDFDSYDDGSSMHGQGGWKGWDNDPTLTAYVTSDQSLSAPHSVDIVGDADLVHEYSGCTSGQWTYTAWQYIPQDFMGSSYFILLSDYADGGGQNNLWSCQIRFDSGLEIVEAEHGGPNLPLITGQWVELRAEIDLDADWYEFYYDGELLEEKAWTAGPNNDGTSILNIGAVDLFAYSASSVYYDNMSLDGEATAPDLDCEGTLSWPDVDTGSTNTDSFTIENIGASESELSWEIDNYPSWGEWTFTPSSGTGLTPEDGAITIDVEVVAPSDKDSEFSGTIKIVNTENSADFCTIDVSLSTPMSHNMPFVQRFIDRHPIIAEILGL